LFTKNYALKILFKKCQNKKQDTNTNKIFKKIIEKEMITDSQTVKKIIINVKINFIKTGLSYSKLNFQAK
jgi:hypothetical protein